jgi:hypothetical protein
MYRSHLIVENSRDSIKVIPNTTKLKIPPNRRYKISLAIPVELLRQTLHGGEVGLDLF